MAQKKGIKFSFMWGIALVVLSGIVGGVYGKTVVDKIRLAYAKESWHHKTLQATLDKTDKLYKDRFVTVYPTYRAPDAQASIAKPAPHKSSKMTARQ